MLMGLRRAALGVGAVFAGAGIFKSLIGFNATIEDSKIQIAGMMAMANKTNLSDEVSNANGLFDRLLERSRESRGTIEELVRTAAMITEPLVSAGATMQELEDMTLATTVAGKAFGVQWLSAARDVMQAMQGNLTIRDTVTLKLLEGIGYKGQAGHDKFRALARNDKKKAFKELARAFSQPQVKQLGEAQANTFSGRLEKFKETVKITMATVGKPLFEMLTGVLERFNKWFDENRDKITHWAQAIGDGIASAFSTIGDVIGWFSDLIAKFQEGDDGAIAILSGIAVVIMALVVPALYSMAAATLVAVGPWLLLGAAVAAGIYLAMKFGQKIGQVIRAAVNWVASGINSIIDWFAALPGRIWAWVSGVGDTIVQAFRNAWAVVIAEAEAALNWISEKARKIPVLGTLGEAIGGAAGWVANKFSGEEHLDAIDQIRTAPTANAPSINVPPGAAGQAQNGANITSNVNIYGVKDAVDAKNKISNAIQVDLRNASADFGAQ